ncbi:MAG: P-II family nitrogen regulator [Proteobacteria bacterium]|nr:P-II family nitrogen regulator [Desulfobulbaceae bacterium]MBU4153003.1 P-II family nitrogen regulator [Pseudomonadota bacterium]
MKEIKAYIAKHKLNDVTRALHKIDGLSGMSVVERYGYGIGWAKAKESGLTDFHPGVKVEVICQDDLVEKVISAIEKAAHTGLKGDGKIYVSTIEQAVRISSGERGDGAV